MKSLLRNILMVCVLSIGSVVYAQLPTADQVGVYTGKGTFVSNVDLDSPKPAKEPATFLLLVNADGSIELQLIFEGGGPPAGIGDAVFGTSGAVYRAGTAGLVSSGRLNFKGSGSKVKATGSINLITTSYYTFGQGTLKLKKVGI